MLQDLGSRVHTLYLKQQRRLFAPAQTFEDRKLDISRLLNVADDFPDVPHGLLGDLAPSLAPMHHRRAASCSIPQRSSADESIMMQVRVSASSHCVWLPSKWQLHGLCEILHMHLPGGVDMDNDGSYPWTVDYDAQHPTLAESLLPDKVYDTHVEPSSS